MPMRSPPLPHGHMVFLFRVRFVFNMVVKPHVTCLIMEDFTSRYRISKQAFLSSIGLPPVFYS